MKKTTSEKISFLETFLNTSLSNDGVNINIWCPFCKHSNKNKLKLSIHLENNVFHCWLCDKKGSNIPYLISKFSKTKAEDSKKYFKKNSTSKEFSILDSLSLYSTDTFSEDEREIVELPSDFRLLANNFNSIDPDVRDTFKYIINRGITKEKLWFLKIGYSQQSDFKRSVIIPSLDDKGILNFYTSRRIDAKSSDSFKYNNAKVQKKNIIFNEINIDWSLPLTIVEGPLDLLKTNDNATCLLGSSLSEEMLLFKKIVENQTEIYLALDSDVYNKTIYIADLLSSYDIDVKILDTRSADDVGDMTHDQFQNAYNNAKVYSKKSKLLSKISMI